MTDKDEADNSIPTKGTEHYYNAVKEHLPHVQDFYRHLEVPGLGHYSSGSGGQPKTVFDALRSWVESGTAPDTLPIEFGGKDGSMQERALCPYPSKAVYWGW